MNLKCLICSDLFTPSADIHVTPCGHMFHYPCLTQWLNRSRTCPQCRQKTTEKSIHRVFLSVEENSEPTDISTLQNKLDNLQFEISIKENHIKKAKDKSDSISAQNVGLRDEVKHLESQLRILESALIAVKEQLGYFKRKAKDRDDLESQIKGLKKKLKEMEYLNLVMNGSEQQVNDMLRDNNDPQFLVVLVTSLKKELIDSDKKKKEIQGLLKQTKNKCANYKTELAELNLQNIKLRQDSETYKTYAIENKYLKKKLQELESESNKTDLDTTIKRVVAESPIPLPKIYKDVNRESGSPSVPEIVQSIKEVDSPYLKVQSSSVGLSGVLNYNTRFISKPANGKTLISNNKFTIFKKPSSDLGYLKLSSPAVYYDGLGGHSKNDEFPTPQSNKQGTKRSRSLSVATLAKQRKLGPMPHNKLDKFLDGTLSN